MPHEDMHPLAIFGLLVIPFGFLLWLVIPAASFNERHGQWCVMDEGRYQTMVALRNSSGAK